MNDVQLFLVQFDLTKLTEKQFQLALAQVDESSRLRAWRFYHREDAWRFLLGRLLRYSIIKRIADSKAWDAPIVFKETSTGKPYLSSPPSSGIGFNISHDSSAILFAVREAKNPSMSRVTDVNVDVGVDVMKVQLPPGETFQSFVESLGDALTLQERDQLLALHETPHSSEIALQTLYQIWTVKEAYAKALGIGLGFTLSRIEYDSQRLTVTVDAKPLSSWRIDSFIFDGKEGQSLHRFVGSVCYKAYEKDDVLQGCNEPNVFVHPKRPASLQIIQPSTLL